MFNANNKPTAGTAEGKKPDEFRTVPLSKLLESKTNPRTRFNPAGIAELAASYKKLGVVQPLVVRRQKVWRGLPTKQIEAFEIVAGARRFRAAQKAGLVDVPTIIRDYTDAQALKVQLIENMHREGLDPLDEANGFKRLTELEGEEKMTVAQIATEISKSEEHIYARLKLLEAIAPVRTALQKGTIKTEHAVILSRLPEKDQDAGLAECNHPHRPATVNELRHWAKERDDKNKTQIRVQGEISRAKAAGEKVVFLAPYGYGHGPKGSLSRNQYTDAGKSKCDHRAHGFYVDDDIKDYTGRSAQVCTNPAKCPVHKTAESTLTRHVKSESEKRRERETRAHTLATQQADAAIIAKVTTLDTALLRRIAAAYAGDVWHERRKLLCERHGWKPIKKDWSTDYDRPIANAIDKMNARELARFLIEIALTDTGRDGADCRTALAKRYKVNVAGIRRQCIAEAHAKYKAAQAKKTAATAKRAKAKKVQTSTKPAPGKKSAKRKVQTSTKPKRRKAKPAK